MRQELINDIRKDCKKSGADYADSLHVLKDQHVLITGGTGFMGKWIAEATCFLNDEHNYNINLYLLARDIKAFRESVPHLADRQFIHLIEHDIRTVDAIPKEVRWVIHAAGTPDSRNHMSNPIKTMDVIYKGTQAILDACLRLPDLKHVIHISSSYVYGQPAGSAASTAERDFGGLDCNSIHATYSEAKRLAETICAIYRNNQMPVTVVRPFSFIGPYQGLEKPWAINNFIRDGLLGGPIRILGNENTVRSYLYGSDMAFWILKILSQERAGGVYNLGGAEPVSLKLLAEKIISNFTYKVEIVTKASKQISPAPVHAVPDIAKLKTDTGVIQVIGFDEALRKTIEWYSKSDGIRIRK